MTSWRIILFRVDIFGWWNLFFESLFVLEAEELLVIICSCRKVAAFEKVDPLLYISNVFNMIERYKVFLSDFVANKILHFLQQFAGSPVLLYLRKKN